MKIFRKVVILLLLTAMLSSCYFNTPGSQWVGLDGYLEPGGYGFFFVNLFFIGMGFQLGGPLGLGVCAYSNETDIRLGVSHELAYVPNVGIHLFPFLRAIMQRYKGFYIQILFIYVEIGV